MPHEPDPTPPNPVPVDLDTSVAHPARIYDYWLGGTTNFPADREAGERVLAATPGLRLRVQAGRRFLVRVVRFLVAEAGVTQFLDIGTGIPSANNTHEVAQALNPRARVVYVDNDPIVFTHATSLLAGTPEGATDFLLADLHDPDAILEAARRTLDLHQPIAVLLLGVLHLVQDHEDPWTIVARLMAAVPRGSYLVLSHPALDISPHQREAQRRYNERVSTPQTLRERPDVERFLTGLDLVPPGLVQVHQWRPDPDDVASADFASAHGGVARNRGVPLWTGRKPIGGRSADKTRRHDRPVPATSGPRRRQHPARTVGQAAAGPADRGAGRAAAMRSARPRDHDVVGTAAMTASLLVVSPSAATAGRCT